MGMFGRRVLFIGDEGIALFSNKSGKVLYECSIPWLVPNFEEQLHEALSSGDRRKPVLVLFDAVEQHYRKETLPNVGAMDKGKVLKRKLDLAFPSYPIRAAVPLEGEFKRLKKLKKTQKGQQPAYLFAALPESENLERINRVLYETGVPIAGLALLPVESTGLVAELSKKLRPKEAPASRWVVLIGHHETGGIRQVVIKDGDLALTRLTPMAEGEAVGQAWGEEIIREFKATLSYVARFGYNSDDGLDVIVISGEEEKRVLNQASLPVTQLHCLTPHEAAKVLGARLGPKVKQQYADSLHAAWNGKKFKPDMPLRAPRMDKVKKPRLVARVASLVMLVGVLVLGGMVGNSYQVYMGLQDDIAAKENQRSALDREYKQEAAIFDELPVKPDVLRGSLAVRDLLKENEVSPKAAFQKLKNALQEDILLLEMSYSHEPAETLKPSEDAGRGRAPARGRLGFGRGAKGDDSTNGKIEIMFSFALPNSMTLEEKVLKTNEFHIKLRDSFPNHEVTLEKQFGGVSEGGAQQGIVGDAGGPGARTPGGGSDDYAEFKIKGAPILEETNAPVTAGGAAP